MFNDFYQVRLLESKTVQAMSSDFEKAWLGLTKDHDWTMF